ncbi:heme exporter protein C in cytochrome biogenesis operon [Janthinobacterium sp. Marseille]|uniref:Heme exporter protein D n=1 Tax=Herminiimonas aquatilis TaxID=345342 RepID=A0ABW2J596_9BURK|nr:heme exporter protein CcmD [Janthinobacterium sp. Marseille]ABR91644.1 heme exporter protein C in cytochrome biogenesis operon [Janthinobacterium sp. Marseille]
MTAFASFADFLAMGGHGVYVWSAYGLCMALLTLNAVLPLLAHRRYLNDLARRRRREKLL